MNSEYIILYGWSVIIALTCQFWGEEGDLIYNDFSLLDTQLRLKIRSRHIDDS